MDLSTRKNGSSPERGASLPGSPPPVLFIPFVLSVLFVLALQGCTTEDGPEYDVPARLQAGEVALETGSDGAPLILAHVAMNYGLAGPPPEYGPRYMTRNIQCLTYTRNGADWDAHSFRNFQPPDGSPSYLLRNADGDYQPLIRNFDRFVLYARRDGDWIRKASAPFQGSGFYNPFGNWSEAGAVLVGDSAWQRLEIAFIAGNRLVFNVRQSAGYRFPLDTLDGFMASLMVPGKSSNMLIGLLSRFSPDSVIKPRILCYRWNLDPANPSPRKQIMEWDRPSVQGSFFSARVAGENRVYLQNGQDTVAEFGIRSDTLAFLGYLSMPRAPDSSSAPAFQGSNMGVDPRGCLHILSGIADTSTFPYFSNLAFVHRSSCETEPDTLRFSDARPGVLDSRMSQLRWTKDGNPMLAVTLSERSRSDFPSQEIPPSWIYLAQRGPGRKWIWEKIAEF